MLEGAEVKLSVIIPVFNEEKTILQVIGRVLEQPYDLEVIVVDDGSTDGTRALLESIKDNRVKIHFQEINQGKGAALRAGFQRATGDVVLIQDADLEYDPSEYGALIKPILDGRADVVYGSRFLGGPHRVLFFWHYLGNRFLTLLSNIVTNLNLTDMETCYKAFRREVLNGLQLRCDRFGFEPEFTAKVAKRKYRIYEVPISYSGRDYAEGKKIGWKDGVAALWYILKFRLVD